MVGNAFLWGTNAASPANDGVIRITFVRIRTHGAASSK